MEVDHPCLHQPALIVEVVLNRQGKRFPDQVRIVGRVADKGKTEEVADPLRHKSSASFHTADRTMIIARNKAIAIILGQKKSLIFMISL